MLALLSPARSLAKEQTGKAKQLVVVASIPPPLSPELSYSLDYLRHNLLGTARTCQYGLDVCSWDGDDKSDHRGSL